MFPAAIGISAAAVCRLATAGPCHPGTTPTRDVRFTRHQQGFRVIHPSGLPLTCGTRSERAPSGFSLSSAPGRYQPRTSGRGRVWNTNPKSRLRHHAEPPIDEPTHTCDLVSQLTSADLGPRRAAHPVHESIQTTRIYIHADMALKEQALARTTPPDTAPGRYTAPDTLLAFLRLHNL